MILAAGYGSRLAPITDHVPKPLLPVAGTPLIDHIIGRFDGAGIGPIAVNTHHLGVQVETHLRGRPDANRFFHFPETEILGTGGGLDGAREFLRQEESFLLHNGDVFCDADLGRLLAAHRARPCLATLLLIDWPEINSVEVAADGAVTRIAGRPEEDGGCERRLTYSGVGVFSRRLLDRIGPGFSSLIAPLIEALADTPGCVRAWVPDPLRWSDLGTLPRWLSAQPERPRNLPTAAVRLERITGHGSDRRFWRISTHDWSAVAMQDLPRNEEFDRQVAIGRWLETVGLTPPHLLSVHEKEGVLLQEDLGPERLFEAAADPGCAVEAGRRALEWALRLQGLTGRAESECASCCDRALDRDVLRGETRYFSTRFLVGHLGHGAADLDRLQPEFDLLADCVAAQPQMLIHRDFQSQNLHLDGPRIRPVDFQGMRRGPLGYDAASLIFDPYVDLGAERRTGLLDHFCDLAETVHHRPAAEIRGMVLSAALQRLMQALGAYGYLGHVKAKAGFLEHIPAGLARLREVLHRIEDEDASEWLAGPLPQLRTLLDAIAD